MDVDLDRWRLCEVKYFDDARGFRQRTDHKNPVRYLRTKDIDQSLFTFWYLILRQLNAFGFIILVRLFFNTGNSIYMHFNFSLFNQNYTQKIKWLNKNVYLPDKNAHQLFQSANVFKKLPSSDKFPTQRSLAIFWLLAKSHRSANEF